MEVSITRMLYLITLIFSLMSEWCYNQKKPSNNFRKLLKERIEKANPRRKLSAEETKRLAKLEVIANKLKGGENVQSGW